MLNDAITTDALPYEVLGDSSQRDQWLATRAIGVGASEMPAVMGVSRYQSALMVYARKVGALDGVSNDNEMSEAAYWGTRFEKIVAEEFTRRTGIEHQWHGLLLRSKQHPWALATLDAQALGEPLECKTANQYLLDKWEGGAPEDYMVQAHQQMLVTGAKRCRVACLVGGQRFMWDLVERDEVLIRKIVHHGEEFWERVQSRTPPEPDGSESAFDALEALYRSHAGAVELPGELVELDEERDILKERIKKAKKRCDEIDSILLARLGAAEQGRLPNGVVYTLSKVKRAACTMKATEYTQLRRKAPKI